jgi:hypothetical protein
VFKSERNSTFNWWILVDGYYCGMRVAHVRFFDIDMGLRADVRASVSQFDLVNKNKYSFETASSVCSPQLQAALLSDEERTNKKALIAAIIAPETLRWSASCTSEHIKRPVSIALHEKSGRAFFLDTSAAGSVTQLKMLVVNHVPSIITQVASDPRWGELRDIVIHEDTAYITDGKKNAIWAVDLAAALPPYTRVRGGEASKRGGKRGQQVAEAERRKDEGVGPEGEREDEAVSHAQVVGSVLIRELKLQEVVLVSSGTTSSSMLRDCKIVDPRGICLSKVSSGAIELVVAAAGRVSSLGGVWRITVERKKGSMDLLEPLLTDLPYMPVGVTAIPSAAAIVFTSGKHLYRWKTDAEMTQEGKQGEVHDAHARDKGSARCNISTEDVGVGLSGVYAMPEASSVKAKHTDVLYVIDSGGHCIKQVSLDEKGRRQVTTIVGRPTQAPSGQQEMGTALMVGLWQPAFGCPAHNSFLIADTGNECVRLITDVYPHAEQLMPALRLVEEGWGFSVAGDGRDRNARNLLGTIACVHLHCNFWDNVTKDIARRTKVNAAAQQGPEANVSRSVRSAMNLWRVALPAMIRRLKQDVSVVRNSKYSAHFWHIGRSNATSCSPHPTYPTCSV